MSRPEAPVGLQRVGQVGPGPARPRGRDVQRHAVGRLPGLGHAVGPADAVGQHRELHRGAAAVGDAGHPELVGARHELVDELGQQPLDVARLVALVVEVDPAALAAGRARVRHAARAPEAARRRQHDRVALARELHRVVARGLRALEVLLGAAEAVRASTMVGNGPSPVAGSQTSTSSGTPSKLGTRAASSAVGQKSAPSRGVQACPKGAGGAAEADGARPRAERNGDAGDERADAHGAAR